MLHITPRSEVDNERSEKTDDIKNGAKREQWRANVPADVITLLNSSEAFRCRVIE